MIMRSLFLAFALAVPLSSASESFIQGEPPPPVAVLVRFEKELHLKSGSMSRDVTPADLGRVLRQGDVLTCKTSQSWFTLLNSALKEVKITAPCMEGYVLPAPAGDYSQILTRYGRTGGRSRGTMPGFLLWPVAGVRTIPATASHLQWRKQPGGTLTATARQSGSDRVIWTRTGIDASLGEWHDAALEAALRAEVEAGHPAVQIDARLSDAVNGSAVVELLDQASQRKLERDLDASATALSDDARHLVRADIFLQANLSREALEEYLVMLERAPESAVLLEKAAALAAEISDLRAADLVRRARAARGS